MIHCTKQKTLFNEASFLKSVNNFAGDIDLKSNQVLDFFDGYRFDINQKNDLKII